MSGIHNGVVDTKKPDSKGVEIVGDAINDTVGNQQPGECFKQQVRTMNMFKCLEASDEVK